MRRPPPRILGSPGSAKSAHADVGQGGEARAWPLGGQVPLGAPSCGVTAPSASGSARGQEKGCGLGSPLSPHPRAAWRATHHKQ